MRSFILLLTLLCAAPALRAEESVMLDTRPGVKQGFLLLQPDAKPVAAVILFAGGHGNLQLDGRSLGWGQSNFLVRSRDLFAGHDFLVATIDAPSDRKGSDGMLGGFRASAEHAADIDAVIAYLRKQTDVPVWLVGTSRGTESATSVAIHAKHPVAGVVLTSSMSEPNSNGTAVTQMALDRLRMPVLLVAHRDDGCHHTPAEGAERIKQGLTAAPKVEVRYFTGGDRPRSKPCEAKSAHGFLGIEKEVVDAIAGFIKAYGSAGKK